MRVSATFRDPFVGLSIVPKMLSRVDFPPPEVPKSIKNSPLHMEHRLGLELSAQHMADRLGLELIASNLDKEDTAERCVCEGERGRLDEDWKRENLGTEIETPLRAATPSSPSK